MSGPGPRLPQSLALAAANGLLAVSLGAFAAHGVSDPQAKGWLQTAAQYQLVHAAAAVGALGLSPAILARPALLSAWLWGVGALVFAGSLDVLAATHVLLWGAVTPIGGLLMIAGWAALLVQALRAGGADRGRSIG